ncbi:MAG: CHASE3 domain-containing protein [Chitinophagaceae bacterium]
MKGTGILNMSFLLKGIFASSVFILIFISIVSYKHATSLTASSDALQHSYNVRNELEQVISFIKDAETGQRGYLLSHDSSMLVPYLDARDKVNKSMYSLSILAKGKPLQEANLDTLYNLITERFAYMNLLLNASGKISMNDELLHRSLMKEQEVMNKIRMRLDNMMGLEQQFLSNRKEQFKNEMSFTPLFTFLLLIFSVMVFIFAYLRLNSQVTVLRNSNEALQLSAEMINHAEHIGAFSTWRWNSKNHEIEYSDNYAALLETGPDRKQMPFKDIIEKIHPDDRAAVIAYNQTPDPGIPLPCSIASIAAMEICAISVR